MSTQSDILLPPVEVLHLDAHAFGRCTAPDRDACGYYFEALDLIATLEKAGYVVVPNGEHLLHQEEDSWAMEHTVECRQRGLMQCSLHELACSGAWRDTPPGVYRIVDEPGLPVHLEDWP